MWQRNSQKLWCMGPQTCLTAGNEWLVSMSMSCTGLEARARRSLVTATFHVLAWLNGCTKGAAIIYCMQLAECGRGSFITVWHSLLILYMCGLPLCLMLLTWHQRPAELMQSSESSCGCMGGCGGEGVVSPASLDTGSRVLLGLPPCPDPVHWYTVNPALV